MEYPRAYKWNIIEYPPKYDVLFHLGFPQEYSYSYSPRRVGRRTCTKSTSSRSTRRTGSGHPSRRRSSNVPTSTSRRSGTASSSAARRRTVHTGASDVHAGASGVHTGASGVHTGASGVHTGASDACGHHTWSGEGRVRTLRECYVFTETEEKGVDTVRCVRYNT